MARHEQDSWGNNLTRRGSCVPTTVKMANFGSSVNRPRSTTSFAHSHDVSSTAGSDTVSYSSTSSAAWVSEAVDDVEGVGTVPDSLILAIISCGVTTGRSSGISPPYWPSVSLSTLDPSHIHSSHIGPDTI